MAFGFGRFLMMATLVGVPVSSYWLVFRPRNAEIVAARAEIDHRQQMLERLREETRRNTDLELANEEIAKSVASIEARLPSNKELDEIVRSVSDLAIESGLGAPSMKSAKQVKAALFMEQPLEIQMTGDFRKFYDFLIRLEQMPRITRVPDMKLKRLDEGDGNTKAEFTLSIYFQDASQGPKS
jgi:type IV pilus assembly protein PilO